jgi:hypothetical protein
MKWLRRLLGRRERITFVIGEAFPESDPVAAWIASLSRALNDIRTASSYAVRPKQPAHERLYFVRVLASHIREAVKFIAREHDDRPEVQRFVAGMPQAGRDALDEIKRRIDAKFTQRSTTSLFDDIKRLRDDTFHYGSVRDADSIKRMRAAMNVVADEQGVYSLADKDHRAEYADNITAALTHPFEGTDEEKIAQAHEMHKEIIQLIGPLSTFLQSAEAHWLNQLPDGVVNWPERD